MTFIDHFNWTLSNLDLKHIQIFILPWTQKNFCLLNQTLVCGTPSLWAIRPRLAGLFAQITYLKVSKEREVGIYPSDILKAFFRCFFSCEGRILALKLANLPEPDTSPSRWYPVPFQRISNGCTPNRVDWSTTRPTSAWTWWWWEYHWHRLIGNYRGAVACQNRQQGINQLGLYMLAALPSQF